MNQDIHELASHVSDDVKAANPDVFGHTAQVLDNLAKPTWVTSAPTPKPEPRRIGKDGTKRGGVSKETERDFQSWVIDYAHLKGWRVAHFRAARVMRGGREIYETPVAADGKGFPDLLMVRETRLLVAELKSGDGQTTDQQEAWLGALVGAGVAVYVWRPQDRAEIERVLKGHWNDTGTYIKYL